MELSDPKSFQGAMGYIEPKEWEKIIAEPKGKTGSLRDVYNVFFPDFTVKRPAGLPPPRPFNEIQAEKMSRFSFLKNEFARRQLRKSFFEPSVHGEAMLYDPAHERWMYLHMKQSELFSRNTFKAWKWLTLILLPLPLMGYYNMRHTKTRMAKYQCGYRTDVSVYRFHDMYYGC